MSTKKERLYQRLEEAQDEINQAHKHVEEGSYYVGPTCLAIIGILLTTVLVGIVLVIIAIGWAVIRSQEKERVQARYDAAVQRGRELREQYDDLES